MAVAKTRPCSAKVDGRACKSPRLKGDDYCYFHSETMVEKRRRSQKQGARVANLGRRIGFSLDELPASMRTVGHLMVAVEVIIREVVKDRMEPRRATALIGLIRLQSELIVDHDLEERVARLEGGS